MNEKSLNKLPNIGNVLADNLKEVDIKTANELIALGSKNAFIRLFTVDNSSCIHKLFALEGAIQGIRWHGLSEERKNELRHFFTLLQKQQMK